jgi:argininosuccinate lyase
VLSGVIETLTPNGGAMRAALDEGMLATDLADYLVERSVPFREAHQVVGRLVKQAEEGGIPLSRLALEDLRAEHPAFGTDVKAVFDFERAVSRRAVTGGTAPDAVARQIASARERLSAHDLSSRS